jgi:hypothetical protein
LGNNCVAPANSSNCEPVSFDARGMCLRMHDLYPRPMPALRRKVTPALPGAALVWNCSAAHQGRFRHWTGSAGQGGTEIAVISRLPLN